MIPIVGSGQKKYLGPALRALISYFINKTYKAKGYGMTVITVISKQTISLLGFSFVDDADLVSSAEDVYTSGTTMIA